MKIIVDPKHGLAVPDAQVADTVTSLISMPDESHTWSLGTLTLINEFRLRVKRGDIKDVIFVFNELEIPVSDSGQLSTWPFGFCDTMDNQLDELLD